MKNEIQEFFDRRALQTHGNRRPWKGFHRQLRAILRHHIPEESRVLEWGCGTGELLRALKPSRGVGLDFSPATIDLARSRHGGGGLEFRTGDIHRDVVEERFDYIVLNHLTGFLQDLETCLRNLLQAAHSRTRLHITAINTKWLLPLTLAENLRLAARKPWSNWLSAQDIINLLELTGWEVVIHKTEQLFPFQILGISGFFNRFLARLPLFRWWGISLHIVARPRMPPSLRGPISCSVIVPARNEAGNVRAVVERVPVLGTRTELIFVEGHSSDETWQTILEEVTNYSGPHMVRALQQRGKGKWDAVQAGVAAAQGEVLVIQDADLTAPPEDLAKFYEAIATGVAEFANGSRLVYPMESKAMRSLNLLGNQFFAVALSFVLGQPIKDSLCGTKMILRKDYDRAMKRIEVFGDFDPFGDFSLLFGASLLDLRIRDIPIRYKDRQYGTTNISRFRHGLVLMKMTVFGLRKIRFFPIRSTEER